MKDLQNASREELITEIERLQSQQKIVANWPVPPPIEFQNLPSGPPELVHGYKVGYSNGWIAFRQALKKYLYPSGNG